jgi:hypothetical protein
MSTITTIANLTSDLSSNIKIFKPLYLNSGKPIPFAAILRWFELLDKKVDELTEVVNTSKSDNLGNSAEIPVVNPVVDTVDTVAGTVDTKSTDTSDLDILAETLIKIAKDDQAACLQAIMLSNEFDNLTDDINSLTLTSTWTKLHNSLAIQKMMKSFLRSDDRSYYDLVKSLCSTEYGQIILADALRIIH